ncbi:MAG: Rrf2 family transcriptional regulator [Acidimicrobiia bacterium]
MQVTLRRKGDYSVRAMLDVARHADTGKRKAREIAAEMEIPKLYVAQVLADLVRHRLLTAVAGPTGGYSLSRPASEITLLEVTEAAEGPTTLESCVLRGGPCDWVSVCPVHETWWRAQTALRDSLAATSFADLVAIDKAIEGGTHQLAPDVPLHEVETQRGGIRTSET